MRRGAEDGLRSVLRLDVHTGPPGATRPRPGVDEFLSGSDEEVAGA